jgi:hypothetical protein
MIARATQQEAVARASSVRDRSAATLGSVGGGSAPRTAAIMRSL